MFPTLDNQAKHLVEQDDAQTGKAAQNLHLLKLLTTHTEHTNSTVTFKNWVRAPECNWSCPKKKKKEKKSSIELIACGEELML